jgi:exodeoxyribonuclease VII large subunit
VHDIIKIIKRRFPDLAIEIVPVKVQGKNAEKEIIQALKLLTTRNDTDIIILARGGGSLEDINAFNSESVARTIFSAKIPVVSAIGHETDFTISDFVADLRAPTPSAAAELVVPNKGELKRRVADVNSILKSNILQYIEKRRYILQQVSKNLVNPKRKVQDLRLKMDDVTTRLNKAFLNGVSQKQEQYKLYNKLLYTNKPVGYISKHNNQLKSTLSNLHTFIRIYLNNKRSLLRENTARLYALNPADILKRGYSITRTIPQGLLVKSANSVSSGQNLEVMLAKGKLLVRVFQRKR